MKKAIVIPIVVVLVLLVASIMFVFMNKSPVGFDVTLKRGDVSVLTQNDGEWVKLTEQEIFFKELKSIRTDDGEAILTIKNSVIVTIQPNSLINIQDVLNENEITIEQKSGSSWSKFVGVMGVTDYNVETAHTVASVRGTGFYTNTTDDYSVFMLGEGELDIKDWNETLQPFQKVIIYNNQTIELQNLTPEEIEMLKQMMKEDLEKIRIVRQTIIDNNGVLVSSLKSLTDASDEEIDKFLLDVDEGRINDREMAEQSPISLPADSELVFDLNDEIKEQIALINSLNQNGTQG